MLSSATETPLSLTLISASTSESFFFSNQWRKYQCENIPPEYFQKPELVSGTKPRPTQHSYWKAAFESFGLKIPEVTDSKLKRVDEYWKASSFSTTTRPKDDVESMATQSVMVPKIIGEKLSGSTIEEISCGDHFVAVKTDRGMLMTWGTGEDGCLGHGSLQDTSKARVVETLVGYTITQISCGAAHVLALTYDGQVYAWGRGNSGNLGFNDTKNRLKPTLVRLPSSSIKPKYVVCGPNYSFILASDGSVYACGNNSDNKLALLTDQDLDSDQTSQKDYLIFTKVTCEPLRSYKTKSIAAGPLHTAFITETGMLFTAGSNRNSQLGYPRPEGDYRPALVESVSQSGVKDVGCGDTYTIAVTMNNKLYSWGSGRSGRLGLGRMEHTLHPNEISTNGAKFNYQSLSVCHNATLVIGQGTSFGCTA